MNLIRTKASSLLLTTMELLDGTGLKGGLHDSAHVHEPKYCFSPVHAVASTQASSFNFVVNEPIGSKLIARV